MCSTLKDFLEFCEKKASTHVIVDKKKKDNKTTKHQNIPTQFKFDSDCTIKIYMIQLFCYHNTLHFII
jgi:hypothetical protein